jgi:hypothetical protein
MPFLFQKNVYLDYKFGYFSEIFGLKVFYLQQSRGCGMYWKNKENIFPIRGVFMLLFSLFSVFTQRDYFLKKNFGWEFQVSCVMIEKN